jgi:hypothetical protein
MESIIELPRQTRGAEVRASSFNEADNTIDVVWAAGAVVRRSSWRDGPYDEELVMTPAAVRLERLNAGAPFLNTHADWSLEDVIGSVVPGSARIQNGQGVAKVKLSMAPGDADNVAKIRDGIIRNISVGYISHRIEKIEAEGEIPLWRVVDWEPLEISAVPVPADPGAQVRSASSETANLFRCVMRDASPSPHVVRARMAMAQRRAGAL